MRRKFLIPEVIQTSAMDCGPASVKALFAGFGHYVSYGRLREACQTDVDGTSIDTMEEVANHLGLEASQIMMPADSVLLKESDCLPAIAVTRLPGGAAHFVVVWRVHGPLVQVMDPGAGRVWIPRQDFLDSLYIHEQPIPREAWDEWSRSANFQAAVRNRLRALTGDSNTGGWPDIAHLDASIRVVQALVDAGKLTRGEKARQALDSCKENPDQIPPGYWTARPAPGDGSNVTLRGAVLVHTTGKRKELDSAAIPDSLLAVRNDPRPRPWTPVWAAIRESGLLQPALITLAILLAAAGTMFEALLFRGFFDLARHMNLSGQRAGAITALFAFLMAMLVLEWSSENGLLRLGRHLEARLRTMFLTKIPRLNDRYFQSRLISDMAFRAHSIQMLRQLPELCGQFLRCSFSLAFTVAGIGWLYPAALVPAIAAAAAAVLIPILVQPALNERDLRFREMSGALSRFYLDALLGLTSIKAHSAERTLRGAQAYQLGHWAEAGLRQQSLLVRAEGLQAIITLALLIWLVFRQAAGASDPAGLLLLLYWGLSIPATGSQLAAIAWNYPSLRNTMLRFLEPLGSPEEPVALAESNTAGPAASIRIEDVTVVAGGHVILNGLNLKVEPGEHIGVVGISGAGKSSLVGLLLGWHKPAAGQVIVDDAPLDAEGLARLRRTTAWIDPQVHLFNDSLFNNLTYGNGDDAASRLGVAIEQSALPGVLKRLPDGLQTNLGEGGALVSGGEGQRVRMGRAMARDGVRLAILDEPGRGLDREHREAFLGRARRHFSEATLFCITHDVADTLGFSRVLVIEAGRILEDGDPQKLFNDMNSRYRALCDQEEMVRRHMWSHPMWRKLQMKDGRLHDDGRVTEPRPLGSGMRGAN